MKVIVHRVDQGPRAGERIPLLEHQSGRLDPYLGAWSMQRRQRMTPSSREIGLYEIMAARLWAEIAGVDIEAEMTKGSCLGSDEVRDLAYHLHLRTADLRTLAATTSLDKARLYDSFERVSAFVRAVVSRAREKDAMIRERRRKAAEERAAEDARGAEQ